MPTTKNRRYEQRREEDILARQTAEAALATARQGLAVGTEARDLAVAHIKECAKNYTELKGAVDELRPMVKAVRFVQYAVGAAAFFWPAFEVCKALGLFGLR
jgi:hypothetical protein